MKKTRRKNIIRNIRQSLNRFLSIMFIVALGAGFMAGLAAASPDMYESADKYIDDNRLFDIDIKSYTGLTKEDLAYIRNVENVETVQEAKVFDMVLEQEGGSDYTSRVYGILDDSEEMPVNQIILTEGRMPENTDECVIESIFGKYSGEKVSVGDILRLSAEYPGYDTLDPYMPEKELVVTGLCQSPMSLSIEGDSTNVGSGTVNLNVYVKKDFFTCDFFTDAFIIAARSHDLDTFSNEYDDYISECIAVLEPVGKERCALRIQDLLSQAEDQENTLNGFINAVTDISRTETDLEKSRVTGLEDLSRTIGILKNGSSEDESFQDTLYSTIQKMADPQSFPAASDLLPGLRDSLELYDETVSGIEDSVWIYRTRNDLAGFESYSTNVGKVSALAKIFPVFFFIVALLVALTTMSRLIEERRLQIGTLKAQGFSSLNILYEYMMFSLSAAAAGCILGFAVGFRIFPAAINSAYSMMYILPAMPTPVRWDIIAWVAPVTVISILLAALWSCWNIFRSVPAQLMRPAAPAAGKRIWLEHIGFIWNRLSFKYKITMRNLFRYKKRFIMTLIGVAGCTALLLTGFGIRDSVNEILDKQFGEIFTYDQIFFTDKASSITQDQDLVSLLHDDELIASYTVCCQETGKIYSGRYSQEITIVVPEDISAFSDFIVLKDRKSGEPYSIPPDEVILTEKQCEEMNIKPGSTVTLENSEGRKNEVTVNAITEQYVYSYAYMNRDTYEKLFGSSPDFLYIMCKEARGNYDSDYITSELLKNPHILYGRNTTSLKSSFSDSIQSINGVVMVLILAAGLLSIVVLYNLTNVNICERKKELATLKVLGYYKKETQYYIFRETNILSFLGSLAGLPVGVWLHSFVIRTVEVNHIMFGRDIRPLSYILALAISILFTLIVDLIMRKPVDHTDMVEAMKAND